MSCLMLRENITFGKSGRECNDDTVYAKYKKQANKASKAAKLAEKEFERKIAKKYFKRLYKTFYAYARSKSRVKNSVGPLMDDNGSLASTDKEMEDPLNAFFCICIY